MSAFDNTVYDSQFLFIKEQAKLQDAYSVSVNKYETEIDGIKAYIRPEAWDTETFGKNISRLLWLEDRIDSENRYSNLIQKLKTSDCCYIRLHSGHSFWKLAATRGIQPHSTKASQHLDLDKYSGSISDHSNVHEYEGTVAEREEILAQVLKLSEQSFLHNRFRRDEHFNSTQIDEMYRQWVSNEISQGTSKLYFIRENGQLASFFLYRENISPLPEYRIGFVSLVASALQFRDKKYASTLLHYVMSDAKKKKTRYVIANTEKSNEGALKFFERHQFRTTSHLNEYNLWS